MAIVRAEIKDKHFLKKLYKEAFPKDERAPFFLLWRQYKKSNGEFLIEKKDNKNIGFAYIISNDNLAYLSYFAINPHLRGMGYGSQVLTNLKEIYTGKRLFLAREKLDTSADNYDERLKRREFYLKNGFSDLPCSIKEASVIYDAMGIGGSVSPYEYDEMVNVWGGFIKRLVKWDMRVLND